MPIGRGDAGARVDQQQRDIGRLDRALGLRRMRASRLSSLMSSSPAVSNTRNRRSPSLRVALAPVAGDARQIVDQRQALADQAVEQGRLADIRPADDRGREAHR
jgi:hypothetical protein